MESNDTALIIASLSFIVSVIAVFKSSKSAQKSRNSDALNLLHETWKNQQVFEANNPHTLVAIDGANALKVTAALWVDCGTSKSLIHDVFSDRYKSIYCELLAHKIHLPDVDYCGKELITETVRKVYAEMCSWRG